VFGKQDVTQDRDERPSEVSGTGRARVRSRLSYANVTASVALFVALGGTAVGAVTLPRDSVGARQIAKDAVRSPEISKDAVRSPEITKDAVRQAEITRDAVRQAEIVTDGVGSPEIKPNAVGESEIGSDAVGASELAPSSITAAEVQTRSLEGFDLKFDSIAASELGEVYERASTEESVTDGTAHDGGYAKAIAVASCEGNGDQILSGSIDWTDTNDQNEAMLLEVVIDRTTAADRALVAGVFDGGGGAANPAKFVGTATCLRF
jgi:hypothetical protein